MSNPSPSPLTEGISTANKIAQIDTELNDSPIDTTGVDSIDDGSSDGEEESTENVGSDSGDESGEVEGTDGETPEELEIDPNDVSLQMPVTMKKVLEKYPNLKKDFPELIAANFREKEYSELFPTVADAKDAQEKVQTLDKFTENIFGGDTSRILAIVKNDDPSAFSKIVNNYLPNLYKADPAAADFVCNDIISKTAHRMFSVGEKVGNTDLQTAAKLMYQFAFGQEVPANTFGNPAPETVELQKVRKEKADFENSKHDSHVNDTMRVVNNSIKAQIDKSIDPRGTMSPYIKRNAVNDAYNLVMENIKGDKRFNSIVDSMWNKAKSDKYSTGTIDGIKKAHYGRFRQIATEVMAKVRTEALKGSSGSTKQDTKMKVRDTAPKNRTPNESRKVSERGKKSTFQLLSEG